MTLDERAEIVARTALCRDWETLAHTVRVVSRLGPGASDTERATAWLHDVVEDTEVGAPDLVDIGFPSVVVEAVQLLSREHGSSYDAYKTRIIRAGGEPGRVARKVKLADALDNLARCEAVSGVPKWQRLAEVRYRPMIEALGGQA